MPDRHRLLACAWVLGAGCAADLDSGGEPEDTVAEGIPGDCTLPPGYEVANGYIATDDMIVGTVAELEADCAAGVRWRGPRGARAGSLRAHATIRPGAKWPNKRIPYYIDPALPPAATPLINAAIAEWEALTDIELEAWQGLDFNYVRFTNGDKCWSEVGRIGLGQQDITVTTAKTPAQIIGSSFSQNDTVYTWYDDGMVTAGTYDRLDTTRPQRLFSLPFGYRIEDVVGIAIRKSNDHVFVWYADGKMSEGTSEDFDQHSAPIPYDWGNRPTSSIIEIDIASNGDVYTWFRTNQVTRGDFVRYNAVEGATPFTIGEPISNIRGMGISPNGQWVYTWLTDGDPVYGDVRVGDKNLLDGGTLPSSTFRSAGGCSESSLIHEIGHTVGLKHEQQRCDRDNYVTVFTDYIKPDKVGNYTKLCDLLNFTAIGPYDTTSRMHYGSYSNSTDGRPNLLVDVPAGAWVAVTSVIDMSFASTGVAYTWWNDGTVTAGEYHDLENMRPRIAFKLPAGYTVDEIAGIGIDKATDQVITYYNDCKYSVGTSTDLGSIAGTAQTGARPCSDIFAIDVASTGLVYAWWDNNQVSHGPRGNIVANGTSGFTLPSPFVWGNVLGIGITAFDGVFAWYVTGTGSAGTSTNLDASPFSFSAKKGLVSSSPTLTAGDLAAVNVLYP
jgi:hypothetical protein